MASERHGTRHGRAECRLPTTLLYCIVQVFVELEHSECQVACLHNFAGQAFNIINRLPREFRDGAGIPWTQMHPLTQQVCVWARPAPPPPAPPNPSCCVIFCLKL